MWTYFVFFSIADCLQIMCTYFNTILHCWLNTEYVLIFCIQSALEDCFRICEHILNSMGIADCFRNMFTYFKFNPVLDCLQNMCTYFLFFSIADCLKNMCTYFAFNPLMDCLQNMCTYFVFNQQCWLFKEISAHILYSISIADCFRI